MKSKRDLFLSIVILGLLSLIPVSEAASFKDVAEDYWAREYIEFLNVKGIISGYEDGDFGPEDSLTRAQTVKILLKATAKKVEEVGGVSSFPDVAADSTLLDYIETARELGIVTGYEDNTFKPDRPVTRAEFTKILLTASYKVIENIEVSEGESFSDVVSGDWFYKYVHSARELGYLNGYEDGTFKPNKEITRAEAGKIVYKFLTSFADNNAYETALLELINGSRAAQGKEALELSKEVSEVARRHSGDPYGTYKYTNKEKYQEDHPNMPVPWTSHRGSDGSTFEERFSRMAEIYAIQYELVSENIGFSSYNISDASDQIERIHEAMMASTSNHARNILGDYKKVGLGIVVSTDPKEIYLTEVFVK